MATSPEEILWAVVRFQLRLMEQLGYAVELDHCVKCNDLVQDNIHSFCAESGGIVCTNCKNEVYRTGDIDQSIIKALKDAINFDYPEDYISKMSLNYCFNLLKEYIAVRSHKKLKSPELIECLC